LESLCYRRDGQGQTLFKHEDKNGEGFLYLGRAYRLLLVAGQEERLQLKNGRFTLRRDLVEDGEIADARTAFRDYYTARPRAHSLTRGLLRPKGRCHSRGGRCAGTRKPLGV
jgi:hypothetical protein